MIESADMTEPTSGIPIFSLYGPTRRPTENMLESIDVLLVDLQDVGTRVYTFSTTLSYCMEAAKSRGIKVVVLDRPNPINGITLEGNCLAPEWASFVGRYPIPMRHALTLGELARLYNQYTASVRHEVIPMKGWGKNHVFCGKGLHWVAPSPISALAGFSHGIYGRQVLLEGANVSEGRGTTQPFEVFGGPFFEIKDIEL